MSNGPDASLERFREEVIEKLSAGYSRDYLNEGEFEDRVEQATAARNHEELRALIMDLPLVGSPNPPAPVDRDLAGTSSRALANSAFIIPDEQAQSESSVIAIFSGSDRKGVWSSPRTLNVVATFGGSSIDLRDAKIPAGGVTINCMAFFGGVDIKIPDDLNVEVSGAGIFGGFDGKNHVASRDPNTPSIKINGVAIFGGVDVKIKKR